MTGRAENFGGRRSKSPIYRLEEVQTSVTETWQPLRVMLRVAGVVYFMDEPGRDN